MTNAIKALLQMTSVSLQPVPSLLKSPKSVMTVEGEKTGDGISYASCYPNPLKARATTFYDSVHNA
jgi:hypothetical protein